MTEYWLIQNVMYDHTFIIRATWLVKGLDYLGFRSGIFIDKTFANSYRHAYNHFMNKGLVRRWP